MDKIKRYLDVFVPTETCNLKCSYCYIAQKNLFNKKIAKISHTPQEVRKAFSKEKLGGTCLINFCAGGETLLSEDVLPIVRELILEGHYVMIVTNGTVTKAFNIVAGWEKEITEKLFFKFSFHYVELKRLNLLEKFAENVETAKKAGCSYTIEVTPSDELVPYLDEMIEESLRLFKAYPHFTIARNGVTDTLDLLTDMSEEKYVETFGKYDSGLFDFKMEIYHKKVTQFCYAGCWTMYVNLESGGIAQCYKERQIGNIYTDEKINFTPVGHCCVAPYCFNGQSYLGLGVVPGLDTKNYMQMRDRVDADGHHWVNETMQSMFESKLYESNEQFTKAQMKEADKINKKANALSFREKIGKTFIYKAYKKIVK